MPTTDDYRHRVGVSAGKDHTIIYRETFFEETASIKLKENWTFNVLFSSFYPPPQHDPMPRHLEVASCCFQSLVTVQVLGFGDLSLKNSDVEEDTTAFVHCRHHGCRGEDGKRRTVHQLVSCTPSLY